MIRILTIRGLLAVLLVAAAVVLVLARIPAAEGQPDERKRPVGAVVEVGRWDVTPGDLCTLSSSNNQSVHIGNRLEIRHGVEVEVVQGPEDAPNTITVTDFVAAGPEVVAVVIIGPSGNTSLNVKLTCSPPPPTTTGPPPTTVPPTTTAPPPPTTTPPSTTVVIDDCVILGIPCETTTTVPPPPTTSLPPTPVDPPTPGTPDYTG